LQTCCEHSSSGLDVFPRGHALILLCAHRPSLLHQWILNTQILAFSWSYTNYYYGYPRLARGHPFH
jgi:hypothetical protein